MTNGQCLMRNEKCTGQLAKLDMVSTSFEVMLGRIKEIRPRREKPGRARVSDLQKT
jgi:hypothetical protein